MTWTRILTQRAVLKLVKLPSWAVGRHFEYSQSRDDKHLVDRKLLSEKQYKLKQGLNN